ncbi:MAG TPA: nucleotide exchange factor GrpE [Syntrophales bacterium]|nr:nucleotide exchange factor GrpE [Syntrophales bacterium]
MVKKQKREETQGTTGQDAPDTEAPQGAGGTREDAPAATVEGLTQRLKEKEREAAENYDKYLRAAAELENYRKRAAREKAEALKFGQENLIRDILPLLDGMDRALDQAARSCDFESFREGLGLLRSQLLGCLKKHGVEAIDCTDKVFDPNFHEALMQVDSAEHEDNAIVAELEKGYLLNGRLLRPAKVSVCKKKAGRARECEEE